MKEIVNARLETESAVHELVSTPEGYRVDTTVGDDVISRWLTVDEAILWRQTVQLCGGTVFGRMEQRRPLSSGIEQ